MTVEIGAGLLLVSLPEAEGSTTNYLGLTRGLSGAPFDTSDCTLLDELVPHLSRAFALRNLVCDGRRQEGFLKTVLARLPYAAFVVDAHVEQLAEAQQGIEIESRPDLPGSQQSRQRVVLIEHRIDGLVVRLDHQDRPAGRRAGRQGRAQHHARHVAREQDATLELLQQNRVPTDERPGGANDSGVICDALCAHAGAVTNKSQTTTRPQAAESAPLPCGDA